MSRVPKHVVVENIVRLIQDGETNPNIRQIAKEKYYKFTGQNYDDVYRVEGSISFRVSRPQRSSVRQSRNAQERRGNTTRSGPSTSQRAREEQQKREEYSAHEYQETYANGFDGVGYAAPEYGSQEWAETAFYNAWSVYEGE